MITLSKLNTYKRYAGDIDGRARVGGSADDNFTDDEWFALDALLQRLTLCSRGLAAASFRDSAYRELDAIAADPEARAAILGLIPSEPE